MNLKKCLKLYNQEHLLKFYKDLSFKEKLQLKNDLKKIDFDCMDKLYKNSFFDEELDTNNFSPLKCLHDLSKEDLKKYSKVGEQLIKNNEYAIVIMAGGNASRLNIDCPKGCIELNINNKNISLFELYINRLKEIYEKYHIYINLYIMTSSLNSEQTINFFKDKNYFDYPEKYIKFFTQDNLPILDIKGKILLKNKYSVVFGPNGNGDVFESLKINDLIKDMENKNIKYVLFSTVDNVLTNLVDLSFIGATIKNNYKISTKSLLKKDENDKNWVFCKYNNKPSMIPSMYLDKKINNMKDKSKNYLYRDKNITYHMISIDYIKKFSNINLKYHRAYKKNNYMDLDGNYIVSDKQNSFKFEKFIFDAFEFADDMLLYRINENEFCTIKNEDDIKKVENILNK